MGLSLNRREGEKFSVGVSGPDLEVTVLSFRLQRFDDSFGPTSPPVNQARIRVVCSGEFSGDDIDEWMSSGSSIHFRTARPGRCVRVGVHFVGTANVKFHIGAPKDMEITRPDSKYSPQRIQRVAEVKS